MANSKFVFESSATYTEALGRAAAERGIDHEYWDIFGHRHVVSEDVERRLLEAAGIDASSRESLDAERAKRFRMTSAAALPTTCVIGTSDKTVPLTLPVSVAGSVCYDIILEDGNILTGSVSVPGLPAQADVSLGAEHWRTYSLLLPAETPLGYHLLKVSIEGQALGESRVVVCPDRAYLPDYLISGGKAAGLNVTLYGLRSHRNWGCGDFTDLSRLIDWSVRELGVSFIGLNPLHALHNRFPYNTSPYLPLSMFYKNFIYLDIEQVPEFAESSCARALFASPRTQDSIQKLRQAEFVEYEQVDRLKRRFLKILYRSFSRNRAKNLARAKNFADYCRREGDLLHNFAVYCSLDEVLHKQDRNRWTWRDWPAEYHSPATEASQQFAKNHRRLVEFYKYVQFAIEEQLSAAQKYAKAQGMAVGLYHDLALATDSFGSDLWGHPDFYVSGCRVGAPPDDFSPKGQDWAFPPPNSEANLADGYQLFRESIRKIVRHGGALRIDHVMRLFRLFWIPNGVEAAEGTYVQDRAIDLLRILALESVRAENIVVGEDLGTVTDEMRETLARFGILSYRLFYFERHKDGSFKRSAEYPRQALVASTTHDLATIAGFWTNRDIEARRAAGLADEQAYQGQRADRHQEKQRILDVLHLENLLPDGYPRDVAHVPQLDGALHNAVMGFLAQTPSMLLLVNQEDLTKETEQQNLPGSTAQYPNWRRKMKVALEDLDGPETRGSATMFRDQFGRTHRKRQS